MDTHTTYEIPAENVPALTARLEKLARKAAKVGQTLSIVWGDPAVRRTRRDCRWCAAGCVRCNFRGYREEAFAFTPITVGTARPCSEGWTFLGTLDHTSAPGSVLRRMVPGVECPAYALAVAPGTCDHCNKARQRSETFVCEHTDGTVKVVGRQCVADFLGQRSAADVAGSLSFVLDVAGACEDEGGAGGWGRARRLDSTLDALIAACAVIRVEGAYRPSAFDETSTRSILSRVLADGTAPSDREIRARYAPIQADADQAWAVLGWLADQRVDSDFMSNIVAIASQEFVSPKNLGYLAAIPGSYARAMGEIVKRQAQAQSFHVGTVGARQAFGRGRVERVHAFDGTYGVTHFVTIRLDSGAVLSWKASNKPEWIAPGVACDVEKATVKAHTEFRGVAQTEITRASLAAA